MTPAFRFGVTVPLATRGSAFLDRVAEVERAGADTVLIPDHLGMMGPMPALVAAAAHAPRLRVGTFVLNTSFYAPALLARDLATVDRLTGGRLDIGLGAGFAASEFARAGLQFPPAPRRVDYLVATVRHLRAALSDPEHEPAPVQTPPPIVVGGSGDRVLTIAAREADVVALSMLPDRDALADRVNLIRERSADRDRPPVIGLSLFGLGVDREPDLAPLRATRPDASDETLRRSMNLVSGGLDEIVEHLVDLRDASGVSSITLSQPSPDALADFARVIARLRELDAAD